MMHMTAPSTRSKTSMDFVNILRKELDSVKGFKKIKGRVDAVNDGPPVGRAVTVRFVGENDEIRNGYADDLVQFLKSINGVINIENTRHLGKTQLTLSFNRSLMAQLGITPEMVVKMAFTGTIATDISENGETRVNFV